jgi:hypothetical protein
MAQTSSTRNFVITVNGQLVTVAVTYTATYTPGAINQHALTIEPCFLVGTPQLSEIMFDIGDWVADEITAARELAGAVGICS